MHDDPDTRTSLQMSNAAHLAFTQRIRDESLLKNPTHRRWALDSTAEELFANVTMHGSEWVYLLVTALRYLALDAVAPQQRKHQWNRINTLLDKAVATGQNDIDCIITFGEYAVDYAQQITSAEFSKALNRLSRTKTIVDDYLRIPGRGAQTTSTLLALKAKVIRQMRQLRKTHSEGYPPKSATHDAELSLSCAMAAYKSAPLPNTTLEVALCHEACSRAIADSHDKSAESRFVEAIAQQSINAAYALLLRYRLSDREELALSLFDSHVVSDPDIRRRYRSMPIVAECLRALRYHKKNDPTFSSPWLVEKSVSQIEDELEHSIHFGPTSARSILLLAELRAFRGIPWDKAQELSALLPDTPGFYNSIVYLIGSTYSTDSEVTTLAVETKDPEIINQLGTYMVNFEPSKINFAIHCYRQASRMSQHPRYLMNLARALIESGQHEDLVAAKDAIESVQRKSGTDHRWFKRVKSVILDTMAEIEQRLTGTPKNSSPDEILKPIRKTLF